MEKTAVEEYTSTPEGMALFQQERTILEVAMTIRRMMKEQGLSKTDLAQRLGKSKAYVTQLLDGRTNMTLRTICDVFSILGRSLRVIDRPISVSTAPLLVSEVKLMPVSEVRLNQQAVGFKFADSTGLQVWGF